MIMVPDLGEPERLRGKKGKGTKWGKNAMSIVRERKREGEKSGNRVRTIWGKDPTNEKDSFQLFVYITNPTT